ncbi:DUF1073 domain-containing protein [uncultured Anaerovibrio sp.]|uniref:phage portal protein n=1 Tax=uncultured Anaerovibrio sp. TaxID=361586 RepID=UPI0026147D23|nr:DUF1073 domain-containing protein [uncultured Anaerovibrio sp.]
MSRKSKKNKNTQPVERKTTQDSFQNPLARNGVFMPNLLEATQYPLTRFSRDWQTINSLYRSHWVVRRIIDVIPEDMTKNGYKITSQIDPDNLKKLETVFRRTSTHKNILKGLKWGRLYGGAGALIMIEGQEDQLDQPLNMDQVMPGSYKGLLVLDRWSGITPNDKLIDDPSDPEFGLPESYTLTSDVMETGIKVHHSRILRFTGRPLPYLEELAEQYWGASEIEHVIDEHKKRDNVSWNIATLTFMACLRVMKLEGMGMVLATGNEKAQQDLYNTVQAMNALMNNNSIQILGENDSYESHQYTFGGIAQVYDCFMMDVAGAAETPVTKLFGRSPAGMNATGESDLQNYYDVIEEKQENELRPIYDKLLPIIMMSTFGAVPDDFDYEFNPVRRAPEDEMADLASKNTDSVTKAFQAGLISQKVALKELRQQSELTGMWTNISDQDIENADDEVMSPDEGMGGLMGMGGDNEDFQKAMKENPEPQKTTDAKSPQNGKQWITINGAKVLIDNNGNVIAGAEGNINKKDSQSATKNDKITSAQGANIFTKYGFINRNKEKAHEKHLSEFGDITMEQYIARGMELVQMPVGGDILGHKDKNEIITRYNVKTNEFVKGRPDRGIYTFYKPRDKKVYYDVMKRKDLENGGSE